MRSEFSLTKLEKPSELAPRMFVLIEFLEAVVRFDDLLHKG